MKTKDRIKEEIGLEKLLLTLLVAIISSISSWTWSNKVTLSFAVVIFLYVLCVILSTIAFAFFLKVKLKIKELDNYE
ncbi:MAG: hypothetical protein EBS06_04125 [Proteobacteria bacterium]|nr:hypothetical protein [Pseudomonadota bacterium]